MLFTFRLFCYATGECLFVLGNILPGRLGVWMWRTALICNPRHCAAALNLAVAVASDGDQGWDEFIAAIECIRNPENVSASDLFVTWMPGLAMRRAAARLVLGPGASAGIQKAWDDTLISRCVGVARVHLRRALDNGDCCRAEVSLEILRSLVGRGHTVRNLETEWAEVEVYWMSGRTDDARARAWELVNDGRFVSPLQPLEWARRVVEEDSELAQACLGWARRWVPEEPGPWELLAEISFAKGEVANARKYLNRALSLNPQDLNAFRLARALETDVTFIAELDCSAVLTVSAPAEVALGGTCEVRCSINHPEPGWVLFALPPAGWGMMPEVRSVPFDSARQAVVRLRANRPDRIKRSPWSVLFVAVNGERYAMAGCQFQVPDPEPGRFLLTITEDHEIHEERGAMQASMLKRLLVDKSRFAASLGAPWTHMVEAGSALSLLEWAAASGDESWTDLYEAAKAHIAQEVAAGNDVQIHLHSFNDPAYSHFPYSIQGSDLRPALGFLLTSPDSRGDWASACPAPGQSSALNGCKSPDRIHSAARAVGQIESIGRLGDSNYRAVLWRSGLLDFGTSDADRAWSSVALRRAGLFAASDDAKPGSPLTTEVAPAFPASWCDPFTPSAGGPLLQLPVAANLEGDYLMGARLLQRRAKALAKRVKDSDGNLSPGVHLFTLLTHDKFINARLGGSEFRLDPDYGDWSTIRKHIDVWTASGASVVTAREGVKAVLDDTAWQITPWLEQETFVLRDDGDPCEIRYRISLLGRGITPSPFFPHQVLVSIPASIRDLVTSIKISQSGEEFDPEIEIDSGTFWISVTRNEEPIYCTFLLREFAGPRLDRVKRLSDDTRMLSLSSDVQFLRSRVLAPWNLLQAEPGPAKLNAVAWDDRGRELDCTVDKDGLVFSPVAFQAAANGFRAGIGLCVESVDSTPFAAAFAEAGSRCTVPAEELANVS